MALRSYEASAGMKPRLLFLDRHPAHDRELLVIGAVIAVGLGFGIALGFWTA